MEKTDLLPADYVHKIEAYCARGEHCPSQLRRKVLTDGGTAEKAEQLINHLIEEDYINTARFCRAYVHDKVHYQAWGRNKIRAMLIGLELPHNDIDDALLTIDEQIYTDNLLRLAQSNHNKTREQQLRFLLQRGFTYDEILHKWKQKPSK